MKEEEMERQRRRREGWEKGVKLRREKGEWKKGREGGRDGERKGGRAERGIDKMGGGGRRERRNGREDIKRHGQKEKEESYSKLIFCSFLYLLVHVCWTHLMALG